MYVIILTIKYTNIAIALLTGLKYKTYRYAANRMNAISQHVDKMIPSTDNSLIWKLSTKNIERAAEYSYTNMGINNTHTTTLQIFFLRLVFFQKHLFVTIGNNAQ